MPRPGGFNPGLIDMHRLATQVYTLSSNTCSRWIRLTGATVAPVLQGFAPAFPWLSMPFVLV